MKILLLISLLMAGLFPANQETWKTLEEKNYSVQYPADWQLNKDGLMGTSFILFSPLESPSDIFRENVNLLVQDLSGMNLDLDAFIKLSEEQVKSMIVNSSMIESKRLKKGNQEFHKMSYTGDQSTLHLQFDQYIWIIGEKAYVLSFTVEQTNAAKYKEVGSKIMDSFKITE